MEVCSKIAKKHTGGVVVVGSNPAVPTNRKWPVSWSGVVVVALRVAVQILPSRPIVQAVIPKRS